MSSFYYTFTYRTTELWFGIPHVFQIFRVYYSLVFFTLLLNRNKNCYRQEISECLIRKALQGTSGRKEQRDVLEKAIDATRFLLN